MKVILQNSIKERIGQEDTDENIFWNGLKAIYELNVYHIQVNTNLMVELNSKTKLEAGDEVEKNFADESIFRDYNWTIEGWGEV